MLFRSLRLVFLTAIVITPTVSRRCYRLFYKKIEPLRGRDFSDDEGQGDTPAPFAIDNAPKPGCHAPCTPEKSRRQCKTAYAISEAAGKRQGDGQRLRKKSL
jgi:hypothetical protein